MSLSTSLPPLILHPFADAGGPDRLVESSRASLMIQGLLPSGERSAEELDRSLLDGRYCEVRMLYYVGKDLVRWIDQCMEHVERQAEFNGANIRDQSFAAYLVNHTPPAVQAKLRKWGVNDYKAIFSRAMGLNAMWALAPSRESLSNDFVRNYYRYADQLFTCRQTQLPFTDISGFGFEFDIYASGEYSRMLEREWAETEVGDET
jgi:hypothetical protein